jgi:hypothetical protein
MAAYVAVAGSRAALVGAINSGSDAWYIALSTTTPSSATFTAGSTDLATGGGYTAGGSSASTSSSGETAGVYKLVLNAPATWTATGSGFSFRYALLVDHTTNNVIGYWDYGSTVTLNGTNGDQFTFTPDPTNGVFQVT